jgi:hypothetical protein
MTSVWTAIFKADMAKALVELAKRFIFYLVPRFKNKQFSSLLENKNFHKLFRFYKKKERLF